MTTRIPLALAILSCSATWAAAQDLNIKPGLWESTVTYETKGDPMSLMSAADKAQMEEAKAQMEEAKAHMSPAQRAQMEPLMKQQAAMASAWAKPQTKKACVTKENLHKMLSDFAAAKDQSNCKITAVKSTGAVLEGREVCSENGHNSNVTVRFEAPNPETFTARVEASVSGGGAAVYEVKFTSSGKWLGSACGDVKP
jgi:hypothetical protein